MGLIKWATLSPQLTLPNLTGDLYCFNWPVGHCRHCEALCACWPVASSQQSLAELEAPDCGGQSCSPASPVCEVYSDCLLGLSQQFWSSDRLPCGCSCPFNGLHLLYSSICVSMPLVYPEVEILHHHFVGIFPTVCHLPLNCVSFFPTRERSDSLCINVWMDLFLPAWCGFLVLFKFCQLDRS